MSGGPRPFPAFFLALSSFLRWPTTPGGGEGLLISLEGPEAPEDFCTGVSAVEGLSPVSLEEGWDLRIPGRLL